MILIIDNYDSFTYNLVQHLRQMDAAVEVVRNDRIGVAQIAARPPAGIVLSPGPGRPEAAGVCMDLIRGFSGRIPILGVCLGHQAIAAAFGARIVAARRLMHGKTSMVTGDGKGVLAGLHRPFQAMRYHSLAVAAESLPACLEISARADDAEIMGLRHTTHPTEGIQFHPESIMTPMGKRILRNFLNLAERTAAGSRHPEE
jgi:anthranilate synthase/aminodeoxychorismate synthase-like glutamine amidotransferase